MFLRVATVLVEICVVSVCAVTAVSIATDERRT
jgi:hypothetical protein